MVIQSAAPAIHSDGPYDAAMVAMAPLLAHQGGWDEILFVIGPIVLIIGILFVVKRRVDRMGPPQ